jgi:CHAT domain-containing protein
VRQELAELALARIRPETEETRQRRLTDLSRTKQALEGRLAREGVFAAVERTGLDVEALLKVLPEDVAFVDFVLSVSRSRKVAGVGEDEERPFYEAFILRRPRTPKDRPITWVHLGSATPIEDAITAWRKAIAQKKGGPQDGDGLTEEQRQALPQYRLRRLVWERLEPRLGDCKTVLLIPDQALTQLPWVALPGKRPRTYLGEEYAFATAGHGQQVIDLLQRPARSEKGKLLLVGDVSYDAVPKPAAQDGPLTRGPALRDRPFQWEELSETRIETDRIARLWNAPKELTYLRGAVADENTLRHHLPACSHVHLATHGFFADSEFLSIFQPQPPREREQLAGRAARGEQGLVTARNPLVLSGVVLAGANVLRRRDPLTVAGTGDGILTAEEVVSLDLSRTDLVVLSACETGLGNVAAGEGVFGLQRAFSLAGARTTIATLWRVEDAATRELMGEFYARLWAARPAGKLEALRQAQHLFLRSYNGEQHRLAPAEGGARPLLKRSAGPLPPYYWASFTLNGDWR